MFLKIPIFGGFLLKSETERFSSTMYLLMSSGIVLDDALQETSQVLNNAYLKDRLNKIIKSVKEGSDFSRALMREQIFPDIFNQLISSGYRSGNLTPMFKKAADFMKSEIETTRSTVLSLIEPLIIIIMGGFILLIVMAILIPIMQMNTLILN
jgi:general secretion pathway protein F